MVSPTHKWRVDDSPRWVESIWYYFSDIDNGGYILLMEETRVPWEFYLPATVFTKNIFDKLARKSLLTNKNLFLIKQIFYEIFP